MGKTQAQFAVQVVETAVTTVARWETSHPPQGDLLLRLGEIAQQQGMFDLRNVFRKLYAKEAVRKLGFDLMRIQETETEPAHGYYFKHISGELALSGIQDFNILLSQLESPNPKVKRNAISLLSVLREGVRKFENPAVGEIHDALLPARAGQPLSSAPKSKQQKNSKQSRVTEGANQ